MSAVGSGEEDIVSRAISPNSKFEKVVYKGPNLSQWLLTRGCHLLCLVSYDAHVSYVAIYTMLPCDVHATTLSPSRPFLHPPSSLTRWQCIRHLQALRAFPHFGSFLYWLLEQVLKVASGTDRYHTESFLHHRSQILQLSYHLLLIKAIS